MNTNPAPTAPPKSGLNHSRICREESDTPQAETEALYAQLVRRNVA